MSRQIWTCVGTLTNFVWYGMQLDTHGKYHPVYLTVSDAWVVSAPINREITNHRVPSLLVLKIEDRLNFLKRLMARNHASSHRACSHF